MFAANVAERDRRSLLVVCDGGENEADNQAADNDGLVIDAPEPAQTDIGEVGSASHAYADDA